MVLIPVWESATRGLAHRLHGQCFAVQWRAKHFVVGYSAAAALNDAEPSGTMMAKRAYSEHVLTAPGPLGSSPQTLLNEF